MNPLFFSAANSTVRVETWRLNLPIICTRGHCCSLLLRFTPLILGEASCRSQQRERSPNKPGWRIPFLQPSSFALIHQPWGEGSSKVARWSLRHARTSNEVVLPVPDTLSGGQLLPLFYSTKWLYCIKERERLFSLLSIWHVACCCQLVNSKCYTVVLMIFYYWKNSLLFLEIFPPSLHSKTPMNYFSLFRIGISKCPFN